MRLGKKGMEDKLSFTIWEIVVIFMVAITLTMAVRGIANNTTYWKKYHSTDLALMTDLMLVNQGDFAINYNMKELEGDFAKKTLRLNPLIFQISLKKDSYFVYDTSSDDDRFPQSYIFAKSKGMTVMNSTTISDYIILYKTGDTFNIGNSLLGTTTSCAAFDTAADISTKHFDVLSISDNSRKYVDYLSASLNQLGTGDDAEVLIVIASNAANQYYTYYDTISENKGKSEKLSCLVMRQFMDKYPDADIKQIQYDNSLDTDQFIGQRNNYIFWIIINVDENMAEKDLSDIIKGALVGYYGNNQN